MKIIKKQCAAILFGGVAAVFLLMFVPFNIQKQTQINASLYDMSKQYTDLRYWQSWYPPLKNTKGTIQFSEKTNAINGMVRWDDNSLLTTAYNPAAIVVKETKNNRTVYQFINGFPSNKGNSTIITWTKRANGWQWIKENLFSAGDMSQGLHNLKQLCENPGNNYGYDIQVEGVKDTIIATKKMTVSKNEKLQTVHLLYDTLRAFLKMQGIDLDKDYFFVSTLPVDNEDSIAVAVGLPVNKKGDEVNGTQFLELPSNGRLLIGNYTGVYGSVNKLYSAMDRYVKDQGLKIVAQSMEQHASFSSLQNDSSKLTLRLIYPIY